MNIFEKIERLIALRKISQNSMIKGIGLTSAGYYKMKKNDDIKFSTLENICQFLNISVYDLLKNDLGQLENIGPYEVQEPKELYLVDKNGLYKDFEELKSLVDKINTKLK